MVFERDLPSYSPREVSKMEVLASFSSVGSCSFYNLENYKESETKIIGRPPSVCVLILKYEYQFVGFTDEIQINIFFQKI